MNKASLLLRPPLPSAIDTLHWALSFAFYRLSMLCFIFFEDVSESQVLDITVVYFVLVQVSVDIVHTSLQRNELLKNQSGVCDFFGVFKCSVFTLIHHT